MRFINHYECPYCGTAWTDEWDCACDDRCPTCDVSIQPEFTEDLEETERKEKGLHGFLKKLGRRIAGAYGRTAKKAQKHLANRGIRRLGRASLREWR